jgi:hypothetical protein
LISFYHLNKAAFVIRPSALPPVVAFVDRASDRTSEQWIWTVNPGEDGEPIEIVSRRADEVIKVSEEMNRALGALVSVVAPENFIQADSRDEGES